jgi:hypothetical protein
MAEGLQKIRLIKWLPWVAAAPLLAILLSLMPGWKLWTGLGLLAFVSSMYLGILLGGVLGRLINLYVLRRPPDLGERLASALSGFGFLFVPPLIGTGANAYLGTEITVESLWLHFLWACVGGLIIFWTKPQKSGT